MSNKNLGFYLQIFSVSLLYAFVLAKVHFTLPFFAEKIMGFSFLLNARLNHRVRRNNKLVNTSHHYSYTSLPRLQPQPEKKINK